MSALKSIHLCYVGRFCSVGGGCARCVAWKSFERFLLAEHRAELDALGISAEQEQEMASIARAAMRARPTAQERSEVRQWCDEIEAARRHRFAEHRAALDALGISAELEQEMAVITRGAERARTAESWTDEVCEETPPAGLTDVEVLADWYEVRGFKAMRLSTYEEQTT